MTPRTLETMIRLSTAHAKARMSRTVTAEDAYAAIELITYAYFKKVLEKDKKRRKRDDSSEDEDEEEQLPKRVKSVVTFFKKRLDNNTYNIVNISENSNSYGF